MLLDTYWIIGARHIYYPSLLDTYYTLSCLAHVCFWLTRHMLHFDLLDINCDSTPIYHTTSIDHLAFEVTRLILKY